MITNLPEAVLLQDVFNIVVKDNYVSDDNDILLISSIPI